MSVFIAFLLCFCVVFNSGSVFAAVSPDFFNVDSIEIIERHGIVEGSSFKLSAEIMPENTLESVVKWSSSNPSVISCTDDGRITGVSAGGYADITCKAKFGSETDKIRVYCVESAGEPVKSGFINLFTPIYAAPTTSKVVAWYFDFYAIVRFFGEVIFPALKYLTPPATTASANEMMFFYSECEVLGRYNSYAYITFKNGDEERDGFVKYSRLSNTPKGFLKLSTKNMNVWGDGIAYSGKTLTSDYKGEIKWEVTDENIVDFNDKTGQVKGLKPGKTTITATAEGMTAKCTVYSLYKWLQTWKTKTNCDTSLYITDASEYKVTKTLPISTPFEVFGDNGSSDGWAYGCATINGVYHWGYIPISHLSTKGTISQYSNLNWVWPVKDVKNGVTQTTKARYISSPYGWRDTDPAQHKGVDITNGVSSNLDFDNSVDGYEVVSAFAGKVIYVYDISLGYKSCGNCVAIRSNEKDPITGKYYVAIYMHLKSKPSVRENQNISANTLLGYVGNTGNSGGSHLHFEVNNQNLSYGQKIYYENNSDKEMVFGSVINPLFFYMNYYNLPESNSGKIKINPTCDAMNYRKPLWYGDDIKESKKP